jgi:hypothetical protein
MVPDCVAHVVASRQFSFINNIFTYGISLQATVGEIFPGPRLAGQQADGIRGYPGFTIQQMAPRIHGRAATQPAPDAGILSRPNSQPAAAI